MKIFMETMCRFIESRVKLIAGYESFGLTSFKLPIEELSDRLTSTQNNLRVSKSRMQVAWERLLNIGLPAFIFLLVLMLAVFLTLVYLVLWVGLLGLLVILLLLLFLTKSGTYFTGFIKYWIYTFLLKLCLKLWKIPPHDDDMRNPRCIFVPWNINQAGHWGEWLHANILPKLQSELRITDLKGLDKIIKNAEYSSNDFQSYSPWRDSVNGYLKKVPLWCVWLSYDIVLVMFIACLIYLKYNNFVIPFVVGRFGIFIHGFVKLNNENVEPDVEPNGKILDVICRLHRVIKKETIYFAVVTKDLKALNVIPEEYRRYFKFLIICKKTSFDDIGECNYIFNMSRLSNKSTTSWDIFDQIIFKCIISDSFTASPEDEKNTLEFLCLLQKVNDDNNNILKDYNMLQLICNGVKLSYLKIYPDTLLLQPNLFQKKTNYWARVTPQLLQKMSLYTTEVERKIRRLKGLANTQLEST